MHPPLTRPLICFIFIYHFSHNLLLGQLTPFFRAPWTQHLPGNEITALAASKVGTLWVGTDQGGLYEFSGSSWRFVPLEFTNFSSHILELHMGEDGVLWIGTTEGISAIGPHLPLKNWYEDALIKIAEPIVSIESGPWGWLWLDGKQHAYLWDGRDLWPLTKEGVFIARDYLKSKGLDDFPNPFLELYLFLDSILVGLKEKPSHYPPNGHRLPYFLEADFENGFLAKAMSNGIMVGQKNSTLPFVFRDLVSWVPSADKDTTSKTTASSSKLGLAYMTTFLPPQALGLFDIQGALPFHFHAESSHLVCAPGTKELKIYFSTFTHFGYAGDFLHFRLENEDVEIVYPEFPVHLKDLSHGTYDLNVFLTNSEDWRSPTYTYTLEVLPAWYEQKSFQLSLGMLLLSGLGLFGVDLRNRRQKTKQHEKALKMQLQTLTVDHIRHVLPSHLVGNAIQHLQGLLIQKKYRLAAHYMESVQDLFHFALENAMKAVPLARELDFIRYYFQLENRRMGEGNQLDIRVEGAWNTEHCLIPAMLTQPIMENAFKYAFSGEHPGKLEWTIACKDQVIRLICRCKASKPLPEGKTSGGKGLLLVQEQLRCFYPSAAQISVQHFWEGDHEHVTEITFPWEEDAV